MGGTGLAQCALLDLGSLWCQLWHSCFPACTAVLHLTGIALGL
jgi:hypothetical protein